MATVGPPPGAVVRGGGGGEGGGGGGGGWGGGSGGGGVRASPLGLLGGRAAAAGPDGADVSRAGLPRVAGLLPPDLAVGGGTPDAGAGWAGAWVCRICAAEVPRACAALASVRKVWFLWPLGLDLLVKRKRKNGKNKKQNLLNLYAIELLHVMPCLDLFD